MPTWARERARRPAGGWPRRVVGQTRVDAHPGGGGPRAGCPPRAECILQRNMNAEIPLPPPSLASSGISPSLPSRFPMACSASETRERPGSITRWAALRTPSAGCRITSYWAARGVSCRRPGGPGHCLPGPDPARPGPTRRKNARETKPHAARWQPCVACPGLAAGT